MTEPAADVFVALADPTRRRILRRLARRRLAVHALSAEFPVSRPAISKHLRVLRDAGLVEEQKHGRERLYALSPKRLDEVRRFVGDLDRFWAGRLAALKQQVERAG